MTPRYEAIIIGTGFGGAINACRLSKKWPGRVLVLERGKRYPLGSFPRTPHAMAKNFWNPAFEKRKRPRAVARIKERGLFDLRNYKNIDVVVGAGLGGGSLIYANVFLEPPDVVLSDWPAGCRKPDLVPYYALAREVLGARTLPPPTTARRRVVRTELFRKTAQRLNRNSSLVDINVFFGNDFANPLNPGVQDTNRYGKLQTSCVYCGECDAGCNYQAKNTLDLNYLHCAEVRYGAEIATEQLVERIEPLGSGGREDHAATGEHGYRVYYRDLINEAQLKHADTRRVIVAAGALGSTELLLRCRDEFHSLPAISPQLGQHFSGNGDFLSFVVGTHEPADPNYGPVITQRIDFNLFDEFDRERAFILEDASYPAFAAWFVEGAKPGFLRLRSLRLFLRHLLARLLGHTTGSIGFAFQDLLGDDLSYHTAVLLCMGLDRSNGLMFLGGDHWLDIRWPLDLSRPLYDAILQAGRRFKKHTRASTFLALPTWWWPFRKNVSVHPLGGCILGEGLSSGVTSTALESFGEVHGYRNLYVADGSILPSAVGANPTATITALAEKICHRIVLRDDPRAPDPTADL
jgi:cholesterol oxidase